MTAVQALFLSNSLLSKKERKKKTVMCVCEHMECERKTSHLKAGVQIYKTKKTEISWDFTSLVYSPHVLHVCTSYENHCFVRLRKHKMKRS